MLILGVVALVFLLPGIRHDLPYFAGDERLLFEVTKSVAFTGVLNPHWFGHPGSTVIYPVALLFRALGLFAFGGPVLGRDPAGLSGVAVAPSVFCLVGRAWVALLGAASVPVTYALGRRLFGRAAGLAGALLWMVVPLAVQYDRVLRSDSAAVLFGMLALLLVVRAYDEPGARRFALAGAAIGLAVSSRWFMVTLVPVLFLATALLPAVRPARALALSGAGLASGLAVFVVTTPYVVLDFPRVADALDAENGSRHLGADGLPFLGNLWWYLSNAIPAALTWPLAAAALAGVVLILARHRRRQLILLAFAAVFLVGISTSQLHWRWWMIQVLPVACLLAGHAVVVGSSWLARRPVRIPFTRGPATATAIGVAVTLALLLLPARTSVLYTVRALRPSTRVAARTWLFSNVPRGARVAQEDYWSAYLDGAPFPVDNSLALAERPLRSYRAEGVDYLVTSNAIERRFEAEPERYRDALAFYREVRRSAVLVHRIRPSTFRGGPLISVYRLPERGG
jgi:hypothetical protein